MGLGGWGGWWCSGAALTCISMVTFRQITINSRPTKINSIGKEASEANGGPIIPEVNDSKRI